MLCFSLDVANHFVHRRFLLVEAETEVLPLHLGRVELPDNSSCDGALGLADGHTRLEGHAETLQGRLVEVDSPTHEMVLYYGVAAEG